MAVVKPFSAVRPRPELAAQISEPPYDVVSSDEARRLAEGNPLSFFHVSKPEIDLPEEHDPRAPQVYEVGAKNFARLMSGGALQQDPARRFYLYRQQMGTHSQVGIVATVSCADYINGVIKRHELTHNEVVEDRAKHIDTLNAQTGPAFLIYRARDALDALVAQHTRNKPEIDFIAKDGVRHSTWTIAEPAVIRLIETEFASVSSMYIADGHHRTAAAVAIWQKRKASGNSGFILAVLFPHNQVQILPYNRVLKDNTGLAAAALLQKLAAAFDITPGDTPNPTRKHELCMYLAGRWYKLNFKAALVNSANPFEQLDVVLLQRHVLGPVFGVAERDTNERIRFIGGVRGTKELERLVDTGKFTCAFSLFPPSVDELMRIADLGLTMPPKSTWFEPKLRDGLFCHLI